MTRKTFALLLTIPLMLFFLLNGNSISKATKPLFETGSEMPTKVQKVYYLLPENELAISETEELPQDRKHKLKETHKFKGKRFVR